MFNQSCRLAVIRGAALSLLTLCVVALSAVAAPDPPRYVDADLHYSFQPPAGWDRKADMPKPTVAYLGPEENGFVVNLTVSVFVRAVKSADLDKFSDGIVIEHGEIYDRSRLTIDGHPARAWRTHLHVPGHPAAENREAVCIVGTHAYELVFTVPPSVIKKYDPIFNKWIASFRWPKATAPTKH